MEKPENTEKGKIAVLKNKLSHWRSARKADNEYEKCIICGKQTDIPVSTPIKRRENYVVGCGQICSECARRQKDRFDIL